MRKFEFSPREILCSIAIVFLFLLMGFFIDGKIYDNINESNEVYLRAVQIENDPTQFAYALRTGIGGVFASGQLAAEQPVSLPELNDSYMKLQRVWEEYTRHTRRVSYKVGKTTHYRTEVYYTWDEKKTETWETDTVSFCGISFDKDTFDVQVWEHLSLNKETIADAWLSAIRGNYIYTDSKTRYYFNAIPERMTGTVYAGLYGDGIDGTAPFYWGLTPAEAMQENMRSPAGSRILFWVFWSILCTVVIAVFAFAENKWLE